MDFHPEQDDSRASTCGEYRIDAKRKYMDSGTNYYPLVRCSMDDGHTLWSFAGRRSPYRTVKSAKEACETHQKKWLRAVKMAQGKLLGRKERLENLWRKSVVGKTIYALNTLAIVPTWVSEQFDEQILKRIAKARPQYTRSLCR